MLAVEHIEWVRREHPEAAAKAVTLERLVRDGPDSGPWDGSASGAWRRRRWIRSCASGLAIRSVNRRIARWRRRLATQATTTISKMWAGFATRTSEARAQPSLSVDSSTCRQIHVGSSPQASATCSGVCSSAMAAKVPRFVGPGRELPSPA